MKMRNQNRIISAATALLLGLGISTTAHATNIVEYFDYGSTAGGTIGGLGTSGGGWAGSWISSGTGFTNTSTYSTTNLTSVVSGYQNTNNLASTGSATAGFNLANRTTPETRNFSSSLTGTIWISYLARTSSTGSSTDAYMGFNQTTTLGGTDNVLGINTGSANLRWKGATGSNTNIQSVSANTTYLFLAKIETNYSGTSDRITAWVNPNLSSLGTGTVLEGVDALAGPSLGSISLFNSSGFLDSIRISDDSTNGFTFVTTGAVPEPSGLCLLAISGALMLIRRRRSLNNNAT